jgi:ABC-type sugar transport system substrate-binding protein
MPNEQAAARKYHYCALNALEDERARDKRVFFVHIDRTMSSRDEWQRGAERVSALIAQVSENAVSRGLVAVRVAQWSLFPALSRVPQAKSLGVAPCAVE